MTTCNCRLLTHWSGTKFGCERVQWGLPSLLALPASLCREPDQEILFVVFGRHQCVSGIRTESGGRVLRIALAGIEGDAAGIVQLFGFASKIDSYVLVMPLGLSPSHATSPAEI